MGIIATNTITLRDVAQRLARLPATQSGRVADSKLLGLLKSGDLNAGFVFPGRVAMWIAIPETYWATVSSYAFRSIRRSDDDDRQTGTYQVRISRFASEYVLAMKHQINGEHTLSEEGTTATLYDELKSALSHSSRRFEVVIREQEWLSYLARNNINEPSPSSKSKQGRAEKTGWRELSVIIGAYLIKHRQTTSEEMKLHLAAEHIHSLAKSSEISGLPSAATIKDTLSKIRAKADEISI
jgi:hypothetical protein